MSDSSTFHARMRAMFEGKHVGIWGFRGEGVAALEFVQRYSPAAVSIADDKQLGARWSELASLATCRIAGTFDTVDAADRLIDCDVVIKSAGVSPYRDAARRIVDGGIPLLGGMQIFLSALPASQVIAVTGTKGKSTTATAAHRLLDFAGVRAKLLGNMGTPVLSSLESVQSDGTLCVLEISSYQAAEVTSSPARGCLTSLYQDHLDWHGSVDTYMCDKTNLFSHPNPHVELHLAPGLARHWAVTRLDVTIQPFGDDGYVTVDQDAILFEGTRVTSADRLQIKGDHNLVNLCGAISLASSIVGRRSDLRQVAAAALESMPALADRMEIVDEIAGITYAVDVLATIPEATVAALKSFDDTRLALLVGGHDRGQDYTALARQIVAAEWVKVVVGLPDTGSRLVEEIRALLDAGLHRPDLVLAEASDLAEAVAVATSSVGSCGTVLLSPAAASFNRYLHYRELSEHFRSIVQELRQVATRTGTR